MPIIESCNTVRVASAICAFQESFTMPITESMHATPTPVTPREGSSGTPPGAAGARGDAFSWWQRVRWYRVAGALLGSVLLLYVVAAAVLIPAFLPTGSGLVNARSTLVRAPHEGWAEPCVTGIGVHVKWGERVATVKATPIDDVHVRALATRREESLASIDRFVSEQQNIKTQLAGARERLDVYRETLSEALDATAREAKAQLDVASVEHHAAKREYERISRLAGIAVGDQELTAARARASVTEHRVAQCQAVFDRVKTELAATQRGVFLSREGPFYLQLREQLAIRLAGIDVDHKEAARRLAAVEVELDAARKRADQQAETLVTAPVTGPIIRRMVHRGRVPRDEPLFEIADENDVFVEVVIHQDHIKKVEPGDRAVIKVSGGPTLGGKVRLIRSSGPAAAEPSNVSQITRRPDQVCVLIDPDEPAMLVPLASRHCSVLILPREPSRLERSAAWLFALRLQY